MCTVRHAESGGGDRCWHGFALQTQQRKLREHTATLGVLPDLALAYIGANLASSFCERVNSAAKLIMTHDRTTLGNKHLEMLCVLRMNRDFIAWMREHHDDWCREWYQKTLQKLM